MLSIRSIASRAIRTAGSSSSRTVGYATISEDKLKYKVVVVGAGTLSPSHPESVEFTL